MSQTLFLKDNKPHVRLSQGVNPARSVGLALHKFFLFFGIAVFFCTLCLKCFEMAFCFSDLWSLRFWGFLILAIVFGLLTFHFAKLAQAGYGSFVIGNESIAPDNCKLKNRNSRLWK